MVSASDRQPRIIRTERGLTITGTRITLYDVMGYVTAQYPQIYSCFVCSNRGATRCGFGIHCN